MKFLLTLGIFLSGLAMTPAFAAEETASSSVISESGPPAVETQPAKDSTDAAALLAKKESEIPLNLDAPKKATEEGHPLFRILFAFSLMGLVGVGAVVFFRKYAKSNFATDKNTQIKVLTQHYLGPKKSLAIVRVAGESILIGVTDNNINMIKSLSLLDEEIPETAPQNFSEVLADNVSERVQFSTRPQTPASAQGEEEEEFTFSGIKAGVSKKLKGMRILQ